MACKEAEIKTAEIQEEEQNVFISIDRFQKAIDAFKLQDSLESIDHKQIVFTGSSSIRMWSSLEEDMSEFDVLNRGFGGSTLAELNHYSENLIYSYSPEILVVYCGENDINDGLDPDQVVQEFKHLQKGFNENLPDSKLVYLSMKPSLARWDHWDAMSEGNEKISKLCEASDRSYYIDISQVMMKDSLELDSTIFIEDGLHMNAKGYELWTGIIKPFLTELSNSDL